MPRALVVGGRGDFGARQFKQIVNVQAETLHRFWAVASNLTLLLWAMLDVPCLWG